MVCRWINNIRKQFFPQETAQCSDELGYDFEFDNTLYEVKGRVTSPSAFKLTANEWKTAQRLCATNSKKKYIVVVIVLYPSPMEGYRVENPCLAIERGELTMEPHDYVVHVHHDKAASTTTTSSMPDQNQPQTEKQHTQPTPAEKEQKHSKTKTPPEQNQPQPQTPAEKEQKHSNTSERKQLSWVKVATNNQTPPRSNKQPTNNHTTQQKSQSQARGGRPPKKH